MGRFLLLLVVTAVAVTSGASSAATSAQSGSSDTKTVAPAPSTPTANILFIAPVGSKSHKNFYYGIIEVLAEEGHKVTVLTPYQPSRKLRNVREIVLDSNDITPKMPNSFKDGSLGAMMASANILPSMCVDALESHVFDQVLAENYDIAFISTFFADCFMGHVHAMNIPFVFVHPAEMLGSFTGFRMGNPYFPSFDMNHILGYENPKTFLQRVTSVMADAGITGMYYYAMYTMDSGPRAAGLFPPNTPHISDMTAKSSLMIVNSFRLAEHPRPYMPNILLTGGLHLKPPKPLPTDLEQWVSSSGEAGFIFFSLGSAVRSSDLPEKTVQLLVSVFKSLPQKVLWKYDVEVAGGLPPNVRLTKWAPQQDLLGDPRMRLFITHGGLLSIQEATYHGVPVLGMPVFGDQEGNMRKAEREGWGKWIAWNELTFDLMKNRIEELIEDARARTRVAELGRLMRDRPTSPAADIAWWTGYLLRTGGAPHLRSGAADLSWYRLYNTDVWLVLVCILLLLLWLQFIILRACFRCCCRSSMAGKKKNTKKVKKQ